MLENPAFQKEFSKGIVSLMKECIAPLKVDNAMLRADNAVLRSHLDECRAKLKEHSDLIEALAARPVAQKGEDGKDGKDAVIDPEWLKGYLQEAINEIPKPRDGKDGKDAEELDWNRVADLVETAVVSKLSEIPPAVDGKDGVDGVDGKDADPAKVAQMVLDSIPVPKDGRDGVGIAATVIDRGGHLIITKTDGTLHDAGMVIGRDGQDGKHGEPGKDGKPGEPGKDGLGFDDMEPLEDGLKFGFALRRGKDVKEFWYTKASLADWDHEIYREGREYPRGACVTTGGSLWIAKADTKTRPDTAAGEKHWRLAVKCGRNGKDGQQGPPGPKGEQGPAGRMVGLDGRPLG